MAVPLIPRALLFGAPARLSPSLSPSGEQIAFLAPVAGVLEVWVAAADGSAMRRLTHAGDRGVRAFAWAQDGRHVLYLQDGNGDERDHLFAVDVSTGGSRDLTPFEGVQARLVRLDRRRPGTVLVGLNLRRPTMHDLYRLELGSGQLSEVARNQGYGGWLVDADLQVRGALVPAPAGGIRVLAGPGGDPDGWRPVHEVGHEDAATLRTAGFCVDGTALYLLSSAGAPTTRLLRIDLAGAGTGDLGADSGDLDTDSAAVEVLFDDPASDLVDVSLDPSQRRPDLVTVQRERQHLIPLSPSVEGDVARLSELCRGECRLLGRDREDRHWLVQDTVDDGPAAYHVYDRYTGTARLLFTHQPELERHQLARMEPFTLTARDGLTLHGYLSFPPGERRSHLPTVLTVHGGPWTRDLWGLRAEPQWLANRGYLCVQVNYRGSTGYGKDFVNAGDREWGGRMQDDLVDALRWVLDRGYADPERTAIYGASYGGYAALVAAAFTPELFRCAIAVAAPSNLISFLRSTPAYAKPMAARLIRRVGDPEQDRDRLWASSPLSRADRIRIPLLIVQGANDPRVPRQESDQLVAALSRHGIPHEYVLVPDEGHTLVRPGNRLAFYARAERFLAEHLGGRLESDQPQPAPEQQGASAPGLPAAAPDGPAPPPGLPAAALGVAAPAPGAPAPGPGVAASAGRAPGRASGAPF